MASRNTSAYKFGWGGTGPTVGNTAYPFGWGGAGPAARSQGAAATGASTRTAPAPAPASASDPAAGGPPVDPVYDNTIGTLQRTRDTTLAGLTGQRTRTLADYGYNEGVGGSLTVNPNDPFSKAALLQRTYDQRRTGNTNSYAARGQLYSGALQNAQDAANFGQLRDSDQLQKALINFLAGNTGARNTAQTNYELGAGQALGDRIVRAANNAGS